MSTLSLEINDLPGEQWENIPEYGDKYQVSNKGRVKSMLRKRPQILNKTTSMGKFKVKLYSGPRRFKNELVGRLVCRLFNREPEENEVLEYKDKDPLNDESENLQWTTRSKCILNSPNRNRLSNCGSLNGMAKLTPEKINSIRELKKQGKASRLISQQFGVSRQQVDRIVKGRTWKTV